MLVFISHRILIPSSAVYVCECLFWSCFYNKQS